MVGVKLGTNCGETNVDATTETKVYAKMDETKVDAIGDANVEANVVAMVGARYGATKVDVTIDKKYAK